jgi:hypothetical protein
MVVSYNRGNGRMGQNGSTTDGGSLRFAAVREVRAYWNALRDDQDLPRREQINPRGMAGALHQVFMLERVAPGIARFRIAGMDINDLMGMEVRGMPLSALFEPATRARLAEVLEKVMTTRTIIELGLEAERGIGRPALEARLLLLPLKGSSGEVDLVLGCLACDGKIGRAPRRFVIARALEEVVTATTDVPKRLHLGVPKAATQTTFSARPTPKLVAEMAEPPAPGFVSAKPAAARPYLRLVKLDA